MKKGVVFEVDGGQFSYKLVTPSQRRYGLYVLLKGSIPIGYAKTEKESVDKLFIIVNTHLKKRKDSLRQELKDCIKTITLLGKRPTNLERFRK